MYSMYMSGRNPQKHSSPKEACVCNIFTVHAKGDCHDASGRGLLAINERVNTDMTCSAKFQFKKEINTYKHFLNSKFNTIIS